MQYIQQLDETDCGPACLAMIASFYGLKKSLSSIRNVAGTDRDGTNLAGMIHVSLELGFNAKALKGELVSLSSDLPSPFIAHVEQTSPKNVITEHYIVIKKITKNYIHIWDPNPSKKKYKMTLEEFGEIWTGYVLFLNKNKDFKIENDSTSLLLRFVPLLRPYWRLLSISLLISILLIFLGISGSFYFRYIIDEILFSKATITLSSISIGMIVIILFTSILGLFRRILLSHISYKADLSLILSYFNHVLKLPLSFFDTRKVGEILYRIKDAQKIREVLSGAVTSVLLDIMMLLIIGPVLYFTSNSLFFIILLTVPLSSLVLYIFSKLYKKKYRQLMIDRAEVQSYLVESVSGIHTIKALNAENQVFWNYEKKQMSSVWTSWKANKLKILQSSSSELINGISNVLIYWIGSLLIINDQLSLGILISFNAISAYFTGPLHRLINIQAVLQEAFIAADRLGEILDMEIEEDSDKKGIILPNILGNIEISNLSFRYGTRKKVLNNINITIKQGSWIALVGPSGCGKTTLTKLLLKFYTPKEGEINIDGYDIRDIDTAFLRSNFGYVAQEIFMFSGTIAENISFNKPESTLGEIIDAAKKTGAHDFINKLPNRYNTVLGERGLTLSGGERQRIALARALLGKPRILIFDEATSNLDTITESLINKTLNNLRSENITTIFIAHRISTIKDCDCIFVLDHAEIVQKGTHDNLLSMEGCYKDLWEGTA